MHSPRQYRLDLRQPEAVADWPFVVTPSNAAAVEAIAEWRAWPNGALALIGPEASGKTRLASDWVRDVDAVSLGAEPPDYDALASRPVLLDDAQRADDEVVFHLLNRAASGGGALLLTGRTAPVTWRTALPDLRSRLNALSLADLGEPDDAALEAILRSLLRVANIRPGAELVPYLLARIERSSSQARRVVDRLDALALDSGREITPQLARQVLEGEVGALFD